MNVKIGILGLALFPKKYKGSNLGCSALAYSFLEVLNRIAEGNDWTIDVVYICNIDNTKLLKRQFSRLLGIQKDELMDYYSSIYNRVKFKRGFYIKHYKKIYFLQEVKTCNCVFDFTAGDSFTDMYGEERFIERTTLKKAVIEAGIPLILGSQTIGPFISDESKTFASEIIKRAKQVFVRDEQSLSCVQELTGRIPVLTTDIAFFLPFKKQEKTESRKIGFNPSGLLWMGGYTGDNQFGLTVDYQEYCRYIISYLLCKEYEVHLILHAFYTEDSLEPYTPDDDSIAVNALHKEFPTTIISPEFCTPIEAKSYISQMSLFIGARMHATIGSLSSGVPVLPFSYSRKFEGLFNSLSYPFVIEGTKWSTKMAIEKTINWIEFESKIRKNVDDSLSIINSKNSELLNHYTNIINQCL